jgi:hypothetical protein
MIIRVTEYKLSSVARLDVFDSSLLEKFRLALSAQAF